MSLLLRVTLNPVPIISLNMRVTPLFVSCFIPSRAAHLFIFTRPVLCFSQIIVPDYQSKLETHTFQSTAKKANF